MKAAVAAICAPGKHHRVFYLFCCLQTVDSQQFDLTSPGNVGCSIKQSECRKAFDDIFLLRGDGNPSSKKLRIRMRQCMFGTGSREFRSMGEGAGDTGGRVRKG